jgi:hypothetical protein
MSYLCYRNDGSLGELGDMPLLFTVPLDGLREAKEDLTDGKAALEERLSYEGISALDQYRSEQEIKVISKMTDVVYKAMVYRSTPLGIERENKRKELENELDLIADDAGIQALNRTKELQSAIFELAQREIKHGLEILRAM